jgi:hypothetical protein
MSASETGAQRAAGQEGWRPEGVGLFAAENADLVGLAVANVDAAIGVGEDAVGAGHSALEGIGGGAGAGDEFDGAGFGVDHADGVALAVGEPDVAGGIDGDALGAGHSQQLHLRWVLDLALDLVSDRLADRASHLELGGSAVLDGDAQADGELAVFVGGVLRLAPVSGEQFANVVDCLILDGLCGVVLHDDFGVWVE